MSEVSNKRFVHFEGTKQEFIDGGYPDQYQESIVFINGDGNESNNTIYTHGEYYGQCVIVEGDASNSAVLKGEYENVSNRALSQTSMAVGAGNIAGLKGWYYSKIDFTNKKITLSDIQVVNRFGVLSAGSWSLENLNIRKGDTISLVNDSKFDFCSKVTAVDGNIITVDSLPFTSIASDGIFNNLDDNSVYIPDRPDAGIIDFGGGAFAEGGLGSKASNICAHAEGLTTHAYGQYSHAEGRETKAAYAAHAEGRGTKASGAMSHAEGSGTTASGWQSHAEGKGTLASGNISHAEGQETKATNNCAHAEGVSTEATGIGSHTEGSNTKATTWQAHAEGNRTEANGNASHAEGYLTIAQGNHSHAEGYGTVASGEGSHAEGGYYVTDGDMALGGKALGVASHAEGHYTIAKGMYSHSQGDKSMAIGKGSHAEGLSDNIYDNITADSISEYNDLWLENKNFSVSFGDYSHVEGANCFAYGNHSHAEGCKTYAKGWQSHAEGHTTSAIGNFSHASGKENIVNGNGSMIFGYKNESYKAYNITGGESCLNSGQSSIVIGTNLINNTDNSAIFGRYNADGNYIFCLGNGNDTKRNNIFSVDTNNDITLNCTNLKVVSEKRPLLNNNDFQKTVIVPINNNTFYADPFKRYTFIGTSRDITLRNPSIGDEFYFMVNIYPSIMKGENKLTINCVSAGSTSIFSNVSQQGYDFYHSIDGNNMYIELNFSNFKSVYEMHEIIILFTPAMIISVVPHVKK